MARLRRTVMGVYMHASAVGVDTFGVGWEAENGNSPKGAPMLHPSNIEMRTMRLWNIHGLGDNTCASLVPCGALKGVSRNPTIPSNGGSKFLNMNRLRLANSGIAEPIVALSSCREDFRGSNRKVATISEPKTARTEYTLLSREARAYKSNTLI